MFSEFTMFSLYSDLVGNICNVGNVSFLCPFGKRLVRFENVRKICTVQDEAAAARVRAYMIYN